MNALIGLGNIVWHSVSVGIFSALVGILLILLMPIILGILVVSLNVLYGTGNGLKEVFYAVIVIGGYIIGRIGIPVALGNGALWAVVTCIFSFLSRESVLLYQLTIIMLGTILGAKLGADITYKLIPPDDKLFGASSVRKRIALTSSMITGLNVGIANFLIAWYQPHI